MPRARAELTAAPRLAASQPVEVCPLGFIFSQNEKTKPVLYKPLTVLRSLMIATHVRYTGESGRAATLLLKSRYK